MDQAGLLVAGQTERKPPSPLAHPNPTIFSSGRSLLLPRLRLLPGSNPSLPLILLLLLSGVCPNPGPTYPCGECNANVTWSGTSYQCNGCQKWVHARCSGLTRSSQYVFGVWRCSGCASVRVPTPPPATPPRPLPPTSPPVAPNVPQARGHFLQININGILNSHQQLLQLLRDQNILIACIQETKLTATSVLPPFPNYAVLRKDRPQGRGEGRPHHTGPPLRHIQRAPRPSVAW